MNISTELELLKIGLLILTAAISAGGYGITPDYYLYANGFAFIFLAILLLALLIAEKLQASAYSDAGIFDAASDDDNPGDVGGEYFLMMVMLCNLLGVINMGGAFSVTFSPTHDQWMSFGKGIIIGLGYFAFGLLMLLTKFRDLSWGPDQERFQHVVNRTAGLVFLHGVAANLIVYFSLNGY
jgi:hypothetical protein